MKLVIDGRERNPYSRCGISKHFTGWNEKEGWANGIEICKAFPDEIREGSVSHDKFLYPDDNGYLFDPAPIYSKK